MSYGQSRDLCPRCRRDFWDIQMADAIERYIGIGLTLTQARMRVKQDLRPECLCCGEVIAYGNPFKDKFCGKTQQCRKAARRYKYYRRDKEMVPEVALAHTLATLTREIRVA